MPPIEKADFNGDPNLGLHASASEGFCIVNPGLADKCYETISEVLETKVIKTTIAGSRMSGIFCAANKDGVALPKNVTDREKLTLEEEDINITVMDTTQTALGNLILVNDDACVVSPRLEGAISDLKDCFGVPVKTAKIAGLDFLGTLGIATKTGLLAHRDTSEDEMEVLEKHFNLRCGRGTVNFGSTFVGACVLANSRGVLVGRDTTGPELGRVDEALFRQTG